MKMAKANEADLRAALDLCSAMEDLRRGFLPQQMQDPDSEESVRYDYREHADEVVDCLNRIANQGSLFRVCFGMTVLLDPGNEVVDPEADALELHPKHEKAAVQRDELLAALEEAIEVIKAWHGPECWDIYFEHSPEMKRIRSAIAKVGAGETAEGQK